MRLHALPTSGRPVSLLCRPRHISGRRRGSSYALAIAFLPVLLGIAALAVDISLMGLAAQRVQNVADTAALAGATRIADATGAVSAADQTAATNNLFSNWQVDTAIATYAPGESVADFRSLGHREYVTEVVGTTEYRFAFGRIFGLERATITRRAAALCEVWRNRLAEGFIFAGSSDPNVWGIYSDGKENHFNGNIHSNTSITIRGDGNVITGDIRYRNVWDQQGPNFTHDGDLIETPVTSYPIDFSFEDFVQNTWDHEVGSISNTTPGGSLPSGHWHVIGDMTINASDFYCHDSLFVVEGNVSLSGSRSIYQNCTFVAHGDIICNFADGDYSPNMHDVFAFTDKVSSSNVIVVDGSRTRASGVLFAPNGGLQFQGSPMTTYRIGLVANTVTLLGGGMIHDGPASALVADETSPAKLVL